MRLLIVLLKTLREFRRDLLVLLLTVIFAPLFVFLYWLITAGGSTTYSILIVNQDRGVMMPDGSGYAGGTGLVAAIGKLAYADGQPMMKIETVPSRAEAEPRLRDRNATLLLVIPEDFSRALTAARSQGVEGKGPAPVTAVTFVGDLTNPAYAVAGIMVSAALDEYLQSTTGQTRPIQVAEEPLGASAARTEFENYVPGLLVFSVLMLIFLASMTVAREIEDGTLRRLQLTSMTAFDLLGGISMAVVLVGSASVLITFLVASALGFKSQGPLWIAILVGALTTLSVVGSGLLVAAFSRSVGQAFVIANFPLGLFMFFSGVIYPMKPVVLFTIAGRGISLYDIIPATHGVGALNKVLTLGAGLDQVGYELGGLVVLSAIYFMLGVFFFQRRHLRAS